MNLIYNQYIYFYENNLSIEKILKLFINIRIMIITNIIINLFNLIFIYFIIILKIIDQYN